MAKRNGKRDLLFLLNFYDALLRDGDMPKVAAALEMRPRLLEKWIEKSEDLQLAKQLADKRRKGQESLQDYVYLRLSPEAKEVWDRIQFWEDTTSAFEKIDKLLSGKTKKLRQELFVHALICCKFDVSSACAKVGLSRSRIDAWREDLGFCQLMEEIQWHKKNFFENALIGLVEEKHPGAVIFVNRTVNADRGYSERIQVEHKGGDFAGYSIADLDLDLDTRKKLLDAIRRKKDTETQPLLPPPSQPIDV